MGKLKSSLTILSYDEVKKIHDASLKLLQDTGVKVEHQRMLKLLDGFGAKVNYQTMVVKFPPKLVEDSVAEAAKIAEDKKESTFTLESSPLTNHIFDMDTEEIRIPTKKDMEDFAIVLGSLKNISKVNFTFGQVQDVPVKLRDVYAWAIGLRHIKGAGGYILNKESVKYIYEMLLLARGGEKGLRRNPYTYCCFMSDPLRVSFDALEILFACRDIGFRVVINGHMPVTGISAPITLSGSLVMDNAEGLACIVMTRALGETDEQGFGVITVDPSSFAPLYVSPDRFIMNLAQKDIRNFYGFHGCGFTHAMFSDSNFPGIQAGFERGYTTILALIAGARTGRAGYLSADTMSLPMVVFDDESCSLINKLLEGIKVDNDRIGLRLMEEIGIGGNFLIGESALKHMSKYFREEIWLPEIFDRRPAEIFKEDKKDAYKRAKEKVKKILKEEFHYPLTKEEQREMDLIVKKAERDML